MTNDTFIGIVEIPLVDFMKNDKETWYNIDSVAGKKKTSTNVGKVDIRAKWTAVDKPKDT
jgi:hypothetical protein